tara:strand:+ start:55 stop:429 length:375 start_codon:yes stop_codon:yes gene_type:complete
MSWKKKKKLQGQNKHYSISKHLRKNFKSNDEFEVMLNNLSLEEVIALKLELASKSAGGSLYGIPLWRSLKQIVEDAVLKYSLSVTRTRTEMARLLGLRKIELRKLNWIYKPKSYFEEESEDSKL